VLEPRLPSCRSLVEKAKHGQSGVPPVAPCHLHIWGRLPLRPGAASDGKAAGLAPFQRSEHLRSWLLLSSHWSNLEESARFALGFSAASVEINSYYVSFVLGRHYVIFFLFFIFPLLQIKHKTLWWVAISRD